MKKKKKTTRQIDSRLAKREGKKSQAKVGDVREIRNELENIIAEEAARYAFRGELKYPFTNQSKTLRGIQNRAYAKAKRLLEKMEALRVRSKK